MNNMKHDEVMGNNLVDKNLLYYVNLVIILNI